MSVIESIVLHISNVANKFGLRYLAEKSKKKIYAF